MAAASIRLMTPNVITEPSPTTFLEVAASIRQGAGFAQPLGWEW